MLLCVVGVSLSVLCGCVTFCVVWVCHFLCCCVGVSLSVLCVCVLCRNGRWRSQWEAVFSPGGSGELKAVVNAQVTRH